MDKLIPKFIWIFVGAYIFFITFASAQDIRRLPVSSRRRLPTVIITREHLRQRQNSYGAHGDTAAEFVVSAGLDTSKNSAVRIRRIGNRRANSTHNEKTYLNRPNVRNTSFSREPVNTVIRPHPQYRTPDFQNTQERNGISDVSINRRHHLNEADKGRETLYRRPHWEENEQLIRSPNGGYYRSPNRSPPERQIQQYRPPLFVPNYQHNRRVDYNNGGSGETKQRPSNSIDAEKRRVNLSSNEQGYPTYSVKYSTSSVSASVSRRPSPERTSSIENLNKKLPLPSRNNDKQQNNRLATRENSQRLPFLSRNNTRNYQKVKPSPFVNNTNHYYTPSNNPSIFNPKHQPGKDDNNLKNENSKPPSETQNATLNDFSNKSEVENKKEDDFNKLKDEESKEKRLNITQDAISRNPIVESANPDKNGLAETPPLQSNINKIREFQTRLIRKPSLILRDQITVNELPSRSNRPRFGPRSLENTDSAPISVYGLRDTAQRSGRHDRHAFGSRLNPIHETSKTKVSPRTLNSPSGSSVSTSLSRRKRETETSGRPKKVGFDNKRENLTSLNSSEDEELVLDTAQRSGRYDRHAFGIRLNPIYETTKTKFSPHTLNSSSGSPVKDLRHERPKVPEQYQQDEQFSDGTYYNDDYGITHGDVMTLSEFIASPLAEKMRLERQIFFKDENRTGGNASIDGYHTSNGKVDSRSLKNNTMMYLRNLIASRLLHILNLSNSSKLLKSGRSSEDFTSAEQRHIGIMVSPYDGSESVNSKSASPVVRILRGKIVPLPDIPQELIPLILETYKPTYTEAEELKEPSQIEDPKLTESMIDNAILKLLQNDELLNVQPVVRKARPVAYKVSRKSPSTNYVGSLKTREQVERPNYGFKPNEWSMEPRCDRLTEEICLDDSDYPSSAIMSSIYKDKNKFDMMYAEVKVQESQVEGLSRQQEKAYSFEHYFGSYPQASGSKLVTRDYGPNGGFVCPSEVHYARPHRAKNRKGEWKVVVNVGEYTQTLRMEKCISSGNPCKYVVNHMQSTCSQVYSYHRLLVFSKESGLHIDAFRVPTSCACHLRPGQKSYSPNHAASAPYMVRPGPYDEYAGHVETAPSPQIITENPSGNHEKKKSFSNTLWAILGGGQQASTLAQQPQFLDEVQKQILWTQQLKHYPQLMKQISPNQVLKQLLEEDEEDYSIRRQRVRQKHTMDQLTSGGFASHQVPIVVPLPPPPPPPPNAIPRRPIVNMASVDPKNIFTVSHDGASKMFALSSSSEPTKTFSLTKDAQFGKSPVRPNYDGGYRNIIAVVGPQGFSRFNAFKVRPGMYPPKSENIQIPESSLLPVSPQFSSHPENRMKPVMKPMPAPQGSNKGIIEDEDLIAAEKSVGEDVQPLANETVTDSRVDTQDDNDSKINFSYHPILEYLNV